MDLLNQYLSIGDLRIRYVEQGQGPPVVLLPSMLIMIETYAPTLHHLAQNFRVLAIDLPGSGRSSPLAAPWSLAEYAQCLGQIFEVLNLREVTMIGHSNSGPVAIWTAIFFPRRIARLVLVDIIGANAQETYRRLLLARLVDAFFEMRFNLMAIPHLLFNFIRHSRNFINQLKLAKRTLVLSALKSIPCPTLLAWGGRDLTLPLGHLESLRKNFSPTLLHVSLHPRGHHDWLVLFPQEFAQRIFEFARE